MDYTQKKLIKDLIRLDHVYRINMLAHVANPSSWFESDSILVLNLIFWLDQVLIWVSQELAPNWLLLNLFEPNWIGLIPIFWCHNQIRTKESKWSWYLKFLHTKAFLLWFHAPYAEWHLVLWPLDGPWMKIQHWIRIGASWDGLHLFRETSREKMPIQLSAPWRVLLREGFSSFKFSSDYS